MPPGAALSRRYAKLCDIADFQDARLAPLIAEISPKYSAERPHRKDWEFAMAAMFLEDVGRLDGSAQYLDVGAGADTILFWLTQRVGHITAIDIYGRGAFAGREARASMLEDPTAHAPYEYPQDRLTVKDMDARKLAFPDQSFDVVVSFSSIEHFGGPEGIQESAREIGRVLRPGGHAFIVTECFVSQALRERAPVQFAARIATRGKRAPTSTLRRRTPEVLNARELQRDIIGPSGLELMQPLDLGLSSTPNLQTIHPDGRVTADAEYPHVIVGAGASTWTSICLPLRKRG